MRRNTMQRFHVMTVCTFTTRARSNRNLTIRALALSALVLLCVAQPAFAQTPVDVGASAVRGATVRVRLQSGSVRLTGWARDSVHVSGLMAPGEQWVMRTQGDTVFMGAEGMPRGLSAPSELEIMVPASSPLLVRAAAASLVVSGITRDVDVATAAGNLLVERVGGAVRAETMQGTLAVIGAQPRVEASTASGALLVSAPYDTSPEGVIAPRIGAPAAFGEVVLRSVSGAITFQASTAERALIQNVRGASRVVALPSVGGHMQLTSHIGLITVVSESNVASLQVDAQAVQGAMRGEPPRSRAGEADSTQTALLTIRTARGDIRFERPSTPQGK